MDQKLYNSYVKILKNELVPALGCTEPIAIAYAAAKAHEVLGQMPEKIELCCSGNIIKNVKGVKVPNSNGLKGIDVAATLGVVGGRADRELEVLEDVTEADIEKTKELVQQGFCTCTLKEGVENLYIDLNIQTGYVQLHLPYIPCFSKHIFFYLRNTFAPCFMQLING